MLEMIPNGDASGSLERIQSGSAANATNTTSRGALVVVKPGRWTSVHEPATATKATTTKAAAGAGVRNVVTSINATIACDSTAQTPVRVELIDGSTVIAAWSIAAPPNGAFGIAEEDCYYVGTANTAMKLEFTAAGVLGSLETVSMAGHFTS